MKTTTAQSGRHVSSTGQARLGRPGSIVLDATLAGASAGALELRTRPYLALDGPIKDA